MVIIMIIMILIINYHFFQVGLPCKTIVEEECSEKEVPRVEEVCEWYNEECKTEYVKHCENSRREKRGVLQAILLTSAIASQNPETTEAPARVRCYHSPTTTCRHNYDNSRATSAAPRGAARRCTAA